MNLATALTHRSAPWEDFLTQEGLPWYVVGEEGSGECAVLIVTAELDDALRSFVADHLKKGGGVLAAAGLVSGIAGISSRRARIRYLLPGIPFDDISLIDLGILGHIPREANCLRTQENEYAAFAGEWGGGAAVLLPFDPAEVLADGAAADFSFYDRPERLPWERVSSVGKGEVRRLLRQSIEYLHHLQGIPYIHLWYYPSGARNVFTFRIDTDRAGQSHIDGLQTSADEHHVRCSWYLDVPSHEAWLERFAAMPGHEIGLHCYEHHVLESAEENKENILHARDAMRSSGLDPLGYAAPYGTWHPALGKAIDETGWEYSSEFGWAYDTLPCTPFDGATPFATLQVPIHPISIGSLLRVGYTPRAMMEYYDSVVRWKLRRNEPLFFYTHPLHGHLDVVGRVFEWSHAPQVLHLTVGEFASWWKKRIALHPRWKLSGTRLLGNFNAIDESVVLHVTRPGHREAWVPMTAELDLEAIPWETVEPPCPPTDIRRIREADPRRWLGTLFTALSRKFR